MKKFTLERKGDVPLEFEGECLTDPDALRYHSALIQVFRTKGGRYILYVGNYGHSTPDFTQVQKAYLDADMMTRRAIVQACGSHYDAEKALKALGFATTEVIE